MFATADFLRNPKAFMDSNIVIPHDAGLGSTQADGRIKEMVIKKYPNRVGLKLGEEVGVYCLRQKLQNDPPEASLFAYWTPYQENQTLSCMLGNGARFMFTATMDGCSFGIGSSPTPGVCRVAHSNEKTLGGKMVNAGLNKQGQTIAQEISLGKVLDPTTMTVINPSHYMKDIDGASVLKSTTWGVHELGGAWTFYTQKYWKNDTTGKYFLREVSQQV